MTDIIQGDTWTKKLRIYEENGTEYSGTGTVRFALSKSTGREGLISAFEKTMTYDSTERAYIITLTASETATLTAGEQYWFDIGIQIQDTFQRLIKLEEVKVIPGIARAVTS